MRAIVLAGVLISACVLTFSHSVEARVGISLGSGLALPTGSFNVGPAVGDAKFGPRMSLGIDVYLGERLSIGAFGTADFLGTGPKAVVPPPEWYLEYHPDAQPIAIKRYAVPIAGGVLKCFFGNTQQLNPYGKLWAGISAGSIETAKYTVVGGAGLAYGIGLGVMPRLSNHFRFSGDINYELSKIDKNDSEASSSRVSVGVALNILIGRMSGL
jgi:hypothetical protein